MLRNSITRAVVRRIRDRGRSLDRGRQGKTNLGLARRRADEGAGGTRLRNR